MELPTPDQAGVRTVYIGDLAYRVTAEVLKQAQADVKAFAERELGLQIAQRLGSGHSVPVEWEIGRRFESGEPMEYVCRPALDVVAVLDQMPLWWTKE